MPGKNKRWQIFELPVNGGTPIELPLIPDNDVDNYDSCYLPNGNIIFTSTAPFIGVPCVKGSSHVTNTYLLNTKTNKIRRLTFDQEHNWCPTVLNNGQVLYQRWEYVDRSQVHYHHLWTTNPDGTGQMVFYGNMHPGIVMIDAKPIPNTEKILAVFSPGHGSKEHDGQIPIVTPKAGPDELASAKFISTAKNYRDP